MRAGRIILGLCLVALPALAYIPPAAFWFEKMADRRAKMGMTRLSVSATCRQSEGPAHEERWLLKTPGMVRRESGPDEYLVCVHEKCAHKAAGKAVQRAPAWRYYPFLFLVEGRAAASRYQKLAESLKVDLRRDTLARFHGRVAVVLGAKEWERDRPQFWLDKDNYLPLRLMLLEDKALVEILWINWGSRQTGDWVPAVIEVNRDGVNLERCEITAVDAVAPIDDAKFNLPE
ncbi:MAG: hypothetical protein GYA21_10555 [Myxococcales bacterium]|nr:hypothetical protein [Myxococcales bacterium]